MKTLLTINGVSVTLAEFRRFVKVQYGGRWNMFDRRNVCKDAKISFEVYSLILGHYSELLRIAETDQSWNQK